MQREYLELIQLTELYLLQQLPARQIKPQPIVKMAPPPPIPLKPKIIPLPKPSPPPIIEALPLPKNHDVEDVIGLIKTHCPHLVLLDKPLAQKTVFLLFSPQSDVEERLVSNLTSALKKEGFAIEPSLENASLILGERSVMKDKIKPDEKRVIAIDSLAELIAYPEKRRTLWQEILSQ